MIAQETGKDVFMVIGQKKKSKGEKEMMSLKEKLTDVFTEMKEDRDRWLEFQKKCDALKDESIKKTSLKCDNIILEFINEFKGKDFSKVEECLDEFFKCDEIDEKFKAIVALSMLKVIDECQELSDAKVVNIFMN